MLMHADNRSVDHLYSGIVGSGKRGCGTLN